MRRPIEFEVDSARVQCGMTLGTLNTLLAKQGRRFGPDPANAAVTTIGSVVALDASGSQWPKYGSARRHIRSMQVVLPDGEVVELSRDTPPTGRAADLARRVTELAIKHQETIKAYQPNTAVNSCGYHLYDINEKNTCNLLDLIVGSEGTLGS